MDAVAPDRGPGEGDGRAPVLRLDGLTVEFPGPGGPVRPVLGVSLEVRAGEMVGLAGESGAGKTLTALATLDLLPPPGRWGGEIELGGTRLRGATPAQRRRLRGREAAIVFQESSAALDPVMTVGGQLAETVRFHRGGTRAQVRERCRRLLEQVALPDPEGCLAAYPHQLSGGQRQRVTIALALACGPRLLIADEPTTALDVTVQAEILRLLERLRAELGLAVLLITHDLAVIAETCDRLYVLYAGSIVEDGPVDRVLGRPSHPYTRGLVACMPRLGAGRGGELASIPGRAPGALERPVGCAFHPRCDWVEDRCRQQPPPLERLEDAWKGLGGGARAGEGTEGGDGPEREDTERRVRCWRAAELAARLEPVPR